MRARRAGQSLLLLLDVVEFLRKAEIDNLVIGAVAAAAHGAVRATTDADALVSLSVSEMAYLEKSLRKAGFATELRRGDADDPIPSVVAVADRFGNRVDLLGGLRGFDPAAFTRAVPFKFKRASLSLVGPEDFVAMKCFAGGPLDLQDAQQVLRKNVPPIDLDLLRPLTRRYGRDAADNLEKLLAGR